MFAFLFCFELQRGFIGYRATAAEANALHHVAGAKGGGEGRGVKVNGLSSLGPVRTRPIGIRFKASKGLKRRRL
jgi:hypothetical protein